MKPPQFILFLVILLCLTACTLEAGNHNPQFLATSIAPDSIRLTSEAPSATPISLPVELPQNDIPLPSATATPASDLIIGSASTPTPFPFSTAFYEPAGCQQPPEDYTAVSVRGIELNARTYAMLQYAARLYNGEIDAAGAAILKGSGSETNPGPHDVYSGGGVVELSVTSEKTGTVLYSEIEPLIRALRTAGFAAWLWDWDASGAGPGIRIHAVAIGDKELSSEAEEQLTGPNGYFRGYSGVPQSDGSPLPDRHGGPLLCRWMVEAGYTDLRLESQKPTPPTPGAAWQVKLNLAALAYLADTAEKADQVARNLKYVDGKAESASLMCGPLAAAILRDAGLLPAELGPVQDLHSYWLADPDVNGRPWSLFPKQDYDVFHFDTPLDMFDFVSWPLRPGDFLYTYAIDIGPDHMGFDHMFIVTEVDEHGRAYTVTNQFQADHTYRIERLLLYDPGDLAAGVIHNQWVNPALGRTGQAGFDVLRRKGTSLPPGSLYTYLVRPGDTLPDITARFYSTVAGVAAVNGSLDLTHLQVGQTLIVPLNTADVPAQTVSDSASLQTQVEAIVQNAPSGVWGVYIENLSTGEVVSINAEQDFHPASMIKLAVGIAVLDWLDHHPDIPITTSPGSGDARSFEQLLEAMLISSSEKATAALIRFLDAQPGPRLQQVVETWGAQHTTIEPRQSTPADLAVIWKRLYRGELLSEDSTQRLLGILRTPSAGDELCIGGGIPESARAGMAHKDGVTFESGLGVVADSAVVEAGGNAYVIVVIGNQVKWSDYDAAMNLIAHISRVAYTEFMR